jgi:hypothetical protein
MKRYCKVVTLELDVEKEAVQASNDKKDVIQDKTSVSTSKSGQAEELAVGIAAVAATLWWVNLLEGVKRVNLVSSGFRT